MSTQLGTIDAYTPAAFLESSLLVTVYTCTVALDILRWLHAMLFAVSVSVMIVFKYIEHFVSTVYDQSKSAVQLTGVGVGLAQTFPR